MCVCMLSEFVGMCKNLEVCKRFYQCFLNWCVCMDKCVRTSDVDVHVRVYIFVCFCMCVSTHRYVFFTEVIFNHPFRHFLHSQCIQSLRTMSMNELMYVDENIKIMRNCGALRIYFIYERIN